MTTVVFGIEIFIHKIEYITVSSFPSLNVIVDNKEPSTILPYSEEAHPGDIWKIEKVYQLIYIIDAFENCVSCPITFELVSPVETTALGRCTLELKPLICDAIAAHGYSQIASQTTYFRDFERHEVGTITFDIRTILFQLCLRRAATTNSQVKSIAKSKSTFGRNSRQAEFNPSMKVSESYKVIPNLKVTQDFQRRQSLDVKAGTHLLQRKKEPIPRLGNFGNSVD